MNATDVLGYYPSAGNFYLDAACPKCHEAHGIGRCVCCYGYKHDDSEPIFHDSSSDTPTHCTFCEAIIPHRLTREGYDYVAEALALGQGRPEILAEWRETYGGLRARIGERMSGVGIRTKARCGECGRVFDLFDAVDAEEWAYGHDCEA